MKLLSTRVVRHLLIAVVWMTIGLSSTSALAADARAINALVGDEFIAENVRAVLDRAAKLSDTTRYDFLARWVLPSETHATIRMNGVFKGTAPALLRDVSAKYFALSGTTARISLAPGKLDCPAIELIEVARRLERLNQLSVQVTQLTDSTNEEQRRAKAAMLFLIDVASGDVDAAEKTAAVLTALVETSTDFNHQQQWPQTVAAWVALRSPQAWPLVADMLTDMRIRQHLEQQASDSAAWSEQLASMNGLLLHLKSGGRLEEFTRPPLLKNWLPADVATARTKAEGYPAGHWRWEGTQLRSLSSHEQSRLFYRIPLRGEFEVSCELPFESIDEIQLTYAGEYVIPQPDFQACAVGNVRQQRLEPLNPPMTPPLKSIWCRIVVRDQVCKTWLNGRLVRRRQLTEDHDPWLAIRTTSARLQPAIRNLRIDGAPTVPHEVNLCSDESLNGWWSYFDEEVGAGLDWQHIQSDAGTGLLANSQPDYQGTHQESLLRYYRPLTEDASLEYEFLYEPGRMHVHPALDGLAFLLHTDGVSVHPVTDGKYNQSRADPAATVIEPECRRGPAKLPLRESEWNGCRLTVRADAVDISLNEQLIYSRPLNPDSPRLFGFFRYAGESEVQVRNVIWRHSSTRKFKAGEQQLVNSAPKLLDDEPDSFESFEHDFTASGLPTELFELPSGGNSSVSVTRDGVKHSQTSGGVWTDSNIIPVFRMYGDFDLTAGIDGLRVTEPQHGGGAVVLRGEDGRVMMLSRRLRSGLHRVYLTWRAPVGDGEFRMIKEVVITEALAGRFRVVRRGETYYFLFAEYDSPTYRLVGKQTIDGAGQQASQVELRVIASLGSSASVIWKNVRIAADELSMVRFDVAGRDITADNWATLADADRLQELILDGTSVSDEDLAKLKNCRDLRRLHLKDTRVTSRGLRHLANLKQLEHLYLTVSGVDDSAAATLGRLAELRTLGLSYTRVGDGVVTALSGLPKLEVLGLKKTPVTDSSIESFSRMTSLRKLDLRDTDVSKAGFERIRKALPMCAIKE